jgi:hypothetical protein
VAPPRVEKVVEEKVVEVKCISAETAALLRCTAEKLEDQGLKVALLNLASRLG